MSLEDLKKRIAERPGTLFDKHSDREGSIQLIVGESDYGSLMNQLRILYRYIERTANRNQGQILPLAQHVKCAVLAYELILEYEFDKEQIRQSNRELQHRIDYLESRLVQEKARI